MKNSLFTLKLSEINKEYNKEYNKMNLILHFIIFV